MEILMLLVAGAINLLCFVVGARVGQKSARGEEIEIPTPSLPSVSRLDARQSKEEMEQAKREQERFEAIMRNIEAYDGTWVGQEDVPRG